MLNRYGIGVRIDGQDIGPLVIEGGTIDYGRLSVFDQPEPPQCTLTLFTKAGAPQYPGMWPEFGEGEWSTASGFTTDHDTDTTYIGGAVKAYIGAPVWVSVTTDSGFSTTHDTDDTYTGAEFRRFTGRIIGLDYSTERLTVSCVADIEQWFRIGIPYGPSVPFDDSTDTDRADGIAIYAPAPATLHIDGAAGTTVAPLAAAAFPMCLGEYLSGLANDADGLFYADREGRVRYRSRAWTPPDPYTIPHTITDHDIDMEMELGTLENKITVTYLYLDGLGDVQRSDVTVTDSASVARYGVRAAMYDTDLWESTPATNHAYTLLDAQRAAWNLPEIVCHMQLATDAQVEEICALDLGHPVTVPYLPAGAPVESVDAQVIGYSETLSSQEWTIDLHLAPIVTPYLPPGD
jgi:hypothetical protein